MINTQRPSLTVATVASQLPGADTVGSGFNILGTYDLASIKQRLVKLGDAGTAPTVDGQYTVPTNVNVSDLHLGDIEAQVFEDRESYAEHLATTAHAKASGWGFSGEIDATFDRAGKKESDTAYAIVGSNYTSWQINLGVVSGMVEPGALAELASLPTTFTPANQREFFNVFARYGTHYINSCIVGGRLQYSATGDKASQLSTEQITASLQVEYTGVFSASASGTADWSQMADKWAAAQGYALAEETMKNFAQKHPSDP